MYAHRVTEALQRKQQEQLFVNKHLKNRVLQHCDTEGLQIRLAEPG